MGYDYIDVGAVGNLGQEPKLTFNDKNQPSVFFSLAVNTEYKSKSTQSTQKSTTWTKCVAFGKIAEHIAAKAHKGTKIHVRGRLKNTALKVPADKLTELGLDPNMSITISGGSEIVVTEFVHILSHPKERGATDTKTETGTEDKE